MQSKMNESVNWLRTSVFSWVPLSGPGIFGAIPTLCNAFLSGGIILTNGVPRSDVHTCQVRASTWAPNQLQSQHPKAEYKLDSSESHLMIEFQCCFQNKPMKQIIHGTTPLHTIFGVSLFKRLIRCILLLFSGGDLLRGGRGDIN